jgi:hypothetical protein
LGGRAATTTSITRTINKIFPPNESTKAGPPKNGPVGRGNDDERQQQQQQPIIMALAIMMWASRPTLKNMAHHTVLAMKEG